MPDLVARARGGDTRAVGRLLSLVEAAQVDPAAREQLRSAGGLAAEADATHVVGLTGPGGVGKSTLTAALVAAYRANGRRVAVLAVDPSSPYTGGAVLGDRIRMQAHALDDGVFIRSMASRGRLGGLSWAAPSAVRVLAGVGYDVVVVETVGVGQAEVDVAELADTTAVVVAPGAGDGVQAAKAGLLEAADVYVVNKSDQPGADATARDLTQMLRHGTPPAAGQWRRPVLRTSATEPAGVPELVASLDAHLAWARESGTWQSRRVRRSRREVETAAGAALLERLEAAGGGSLLAGLADRVLAGELDAWQAADEALAALLR